MRAKGQVWVETVVYTLVGLSLIGLVLAFVIPKVNEYRDRSVVENTISALNVIDSKINEVLQAPLNTRVVDMTLKRGDLYFDGLNDSVYFILEDSKVPYSEVDEPVSIGRITAYTERKTGDTYRIKLIIDYAFNLDYEGNQSVKKYSPASIPYRFSFTNQGSGDEGSLPTIVFRELSN
jgi:type II secretory pathway pseudopilin PulG